MKAKNCIESARETIEQKVTSSKPEKGQTKNVSKLLRAEKSHLSSSKRKIYIQTYYSGKKIDLFKKKEKKMDQLIEKILRSNQKLSNRYQ